MRELTVREMRKGYGAIAEALERDGELVLTHHGKPYAKVVPIEPASSAATISAQERGARRKTRGEELRRLREEVALGSGFADGFPETNWTVERAERV